MDADGRHLRRIAHVPGGLYRPSFTPDGRSLVADGAGTGLYRVRLRDGKVRQLTDEQDFSPDYSPDGRRIVFSSLPRRRRDDRALRDERSTART